MSAVLSDVVFKAYDIRGTVPDQLNLSFARRLGAALALQAHQHGIDTLVVGYDGRLSSPELAGALHEGINAGGINTIDLGMVPTPLVYYAAHTLKTGSGVAITGSHNPSHYNGFKIMMGGKTLHGDAIKALHTIMKSARFVPSQIPGKTTSYPVIDDYIDQVCTDIKLARPLKIAIDCGNGVGGVVAERLFTQLGCQVDALFCDVDGRFPNHHPDPADPANLQDLITHVKENNCDLGLAFDGDADRLGVVTQSGQIIWPDRQLILYARDVLTRNPGATILFDVKCSRHVARAIHAAGGRPLMWQTGHSLIKAKMTETKAPLAGEMSGHIFFGERWYGFDDGLYTGARLLEILAHHDQPSSVLEALPQDISTPELKLEMQEGEPQVLISRLQENAQFPSATAINTIDGVRAEYDDGFGLARASNTTPVVVMRFEGETQDAVIRIQNEFRQALTLLAPGITLPF